MKKLKKLSVLALLAVGFALVFGGCSNADDETKTEQGGGGDGTDKGDDSDKKEDEVVTVTDPEFTVWYGSEVNKNAITFTNGGAYYAGKDLSNYSEVAIAFKGSYTNEPAEGMKFCVKIYDPANNKYADLGYPEITEANKSQTLTYDNIAEKLGESEVQKPFYLCLTNNSIDWNVENSEFGRWTLTVEKIEFIP